MSAVLPFSIGSALLQTFSDFELLVVGDGCTDDSEAAVAAIGDPRVRWINLPANEGHQSAPNNEGLAQARGGLIAYLGHDDLWLPHHLASLAEAIGNGADLAYGAAGLVRPEAEQAETWIQPIYRPGMWLPPTSVMHRRSLALEAGGWRDYRSLRLDPEADLWGRFHSAGRALTFVPRLTCLKFPAGWRRDVYRRRPHHEQARWLERIRRGEDLEAAELGAIEAAARERDGALRRLGARVRHRVGRALRSAGLRGPGRGEAIAAARRFKGLSEES